MTRTITIICVLLLSGSVALAQGSGGSGGSSSSGGASTGSPSSTPSAPGTNPDSLGNTNRKSSGSGTVIPGVAAPAPSDGATAGRSPGAHPSNSPDVTRR